MRSVTTATLLGLCAAPGLAQTAPTNVTTDPATGSRSWATTADGVHFSLTQILPEQGRAFYVNRGFTLDQIEPFVSSCVYMTVLRNDAAPGVIHFTTDSWSVVADGQTRTLVPIDDWKERLAARDAKKSALIAFRWAQFPPEQAYEPGGDWNQGMLSIGLPPGSRFDAIARWDIDGQGYEATLQGVECAE